MEPAQAGNLDASQHPDEEQWRMQMRRMERRKQRLAREGTQDSSVAVSLPVAGARSGVLIAVNPSSLSSMPGASSSSSSVRKAPPPRLSSSGPGDIAEVGLLFLAAYSGVLHQRARRMMKRA
jgi:hypothetical protein